MNYQLEMEKIIESEIEKNRVPRLLLHACCAPCSSRVLEVLGNYFHITILYYNPNIFPEVEFEKRLTELQRLVKELKTKYPVEVWPGRYDPKEFFTMAKGYEKDKEGGERCFKCYRLRLEETAKLAKEYQFDYFTTTLSISPYKNSRVLNEIGQELADKYHLAYLFADFKKKNGYHRSIELSQEYHLYRQDYCGCIYSKQERDEKKKKEVLLS